MNTGTNALKHVIVPCDGIPDRVTVAVARSFAGRLGIPVILFSIVSEHREAEDADELWRLAGQSGPDVSAAVVLDDGRPIAAQLVEFADAPDALMCLRTHAEPAIIEALFGSIAEAVLRASTRAILAIGPKCRPSLAGNRLIVAVDDDLLHPSTDPAWLGEVLDLAGAARYALQYITITDDNATDSAAHVAAQLSGLDDVSMIAADVRATTTIDRLLIGNATVQLLRHAKCPVLIRGHGHEHRGAALTATRALPLRHGGSTG